jgi:hypothetical protein
MVPLTAQSVQDDRVVVGFVNNEWEGIWKQVIMAQTSTRPKRPSKYPILSQVTSLRRVSNLGATEYE